MALFQIELPLSEEYINLLNDILMLTSSLVIAFLVFKTSSKKSCIFESFPEFYMALLFGLMYHHLLVKKLIQFV
jgi:hypothetical protein